MTASQESEDSRLTRWSLLERLCDPSDDRSWQVFHDSYSKLILKCARDHGLASRETEEVMEEVLLRAWETIPDPDQFTIHRRPGSFRRWLMTVTRHRILDYKRRRHRQTKRHLPLEELFDEDEAPTEVSTELSALGARAFEEDWNRRWTAEMLGVALERLKQLVKARQFQIFWLNTVEGQPAAQVAKCLDTAVPYVHLTAFRMKKKLREQLRELDRE